MEKECTMKMLFCIGLSALLLAGAAHAGERIDGKITAIDAATGIIEVSGVKILAKEAKVRDLIFPSRLSRLKVGWSIEAEGKFTGSREFTANRIEAKYFRHYEINAKLDAVNAQARTLTISGITVKVPADCKIGDEEGNATLIDKLPVGRMIEVEGNWTGPAEFTIYSIEVWKAEEKKEEKKEHKDQH